MNSVASSRPASGRSSRRAASKTVRSFPCDHCNRGACTFGESRIWVVEDLRAENNGPVSDGTATYVQAWLRECQR